MSARQGVRAWMRTAVVLGGLWCGTGLVAHAATLEGQRFDNTAAVAGQTLKLNGLGLRGVAWVKAFVAGLYLPSTSKDASSILAMDGPKRLRLKIMLEAPSHELTKSLLSRVRKHETPESYAALKERSDRLGAIIDSVGTLKVGDALDLDYLPGKGIVLHHNGQTVGEAVQGEDLYRVVLKIFVGERAIDPEMRQGLLRGGV